MRIRAKQSLGAAALVVASLAAPAVAQEAVTFTFVADTNLQSLSPDVDKVRVTCRVCQTPCALVLSTQPPRINMVEAAVGRVTNFTQQITVPVTLPDQAAAQAVNFWECSIRLVDGGGTEATPATDADEAFARAKPGTTLVRTLNGSLSGTSFGVTIEDSN
jgi:hypothetical protein